ASCYAKPLLFKFYRGSLEAPYLTYLANVPWYPGGHHGSSAGQVGVALAIAAFAAVLAEIAKGLSAAPGTFCISLGASGVQAAVVGAAFAPGAGEWAAQFASLIFTQGTGYISFRQPGFDEPSRPWPPIVALLVLVSVTLFHWREAGTAGRTGSAQL